MIQVREYATFTSNQGATPSLDVAVVSPVTLEWLKNLELKWKDKAASVFFENQDTLKLGSYVGYLQSPDGTEIEILPKTQRGEAQQEDIKKTRQLLYSMVTSSLKVSPREMDSANLQAFDAPLHEWIFTQFLSALANLYRKGLRNEYKNIEEESRFIRGQLNVPRQMRQPISRATYFHIRHDIFSPDILENRLLKTSLDYVFKVTTDADNWRLANELQHQLAELDSCIYPVRDFVKWRSTKLLHMYDDVKPWCELIIHQLNPAFHVGLHKGISLLFPMEKLFENYLEACLQEQLAQNTTLKPQASSQYLLKHHPRTASREQRWFQLKPDFLLINSFGRSVLDAKWKLLDGSASDTENKYSIKQPDLYQLYTYGQKYMDGQGSMMLIYPKHDGFTEPLPVFNFDDSLHLWVVPFDLYEKELIYGEWSQSFPSITLSKSHSDGIYVNA